MVGTSLFGKYIVMQDTDYTIEFGVGLVTVGYTGANRTHLEGSSGGVFNYRAILRRRVLHKDAVTG